MVRDVRGLKVVHEQYEKLEHVVDNLNEKTRGLLLRERREFLAAYRAHTYKIQNELRELRRRVAEEQSSQQKDEKVKQLKEDCDWFRQEALELDAKSATLRTDLHGLKDRLEVAEDDRNWLLKELTRTKMQTDLLRSALDAQTSDTKTADVVEAERRAEEAVFEARRSGIGIPRKSDAMAWSPQASRGGTRQESRGAPDDGPSRPGSGGDEPAEEDAPRRRGPSAFDADGAKERERDYATRRVEAKKAECRRLRKAIAAHRASADPPTHEAARLRETLLECLLAVSNAKDARRGVEPPSRGPAAPARADGKPANPDLSLLDPLDLDKFTPTDRIHVLYNLAGTSVVQDMLRDLERRDAGRANAPSPAAHFYAPSPSPGFGGDIIDGDVTHGDLDAFFQSA